MVQTSRENHAKDQQNFNVENNRFAPGFMQATWMVEEGDFVDEDNRCVSQWLLEILEWCRRELELERKYYKLK